VRCQHFNERQKSAFFTGTAQKQLSFLNGEVLLFGHGKIPHFFAINNKFTPHHIKINTHVK
jgi:hypothetical protein